MSGATRAREEAARAPEVRGPLQPGTIFEKYEIVRCIGMGGMGAVYEARHVRLSKRVALKTMLEGLSTKPDLVERILREGETIARIHHPHVVDIYDVGIHDGVPYLVEEFLEGETLHDLLDRLGALSATQIADVIVPIADALAAAHDASVIHRDLKPANIFLARDTRGQIRPKLLDFGISKMSDRMEGPSLTKAGSVIGTPEYMAPEQIHQLPDVDGRADQYALGVVMYECITGVVPYQQASLFELLSASVAGVFDPPHVLRANVDPDLELIVLRAMATDRTQRFDDMHDFVRTLLPLASEKVRSQFDATGALLPAAEGGTAGVALPERPSSKGQKAMPHAATLPATPARIQSPKAPTGTEGASGIRLRQATPARTGLMVGGALLVAGLVGGVGFVLYDREPPAAPTPTEPATFEVAVRAEPADATFRLDGRVIGRGEARVDLARDGSEHVLEIRAAGHASREILFRDAFEPQLVILEPLPEAIPTGVTPPSDVPVDTELEPATPRASRMRAVRRTTANATTSQPASSSAAVDIRLAR